MKKIEIEIQSSDVVNIIKDVAAYVGAKTPDATGQPQYDRIAIFDEDETVINELWSLATGELMRLFNRFMIGEPDNDNTSLDFRISVPDNTKDSLLEVLTNNGKSFMAYCMLSKWCDMANRQDSQIYEESIKVVAQTIKEALYERETISRSDIQSKKKWK